MASEPLKIPKPAKMRLEQVVGRQPKLSDRAPSGSYMTRGVSLKEASGVIEQSDAYVVRGACQAAGNAAHIEGLSHNNLQEHPFGEGGEL